MRDRTCAYVEAVKQEKKERAEKRKTLLQRLELYKKKNSNCFNIRDAQEKQKKEHSLLGVPWAILVNYTEQRVALYNYSKDCAECRREVYMCGINCKLCGSWVCTVCIILYDGVSLCGECYRLVKLQEKEITRIKVDLHHRILKKCIQNPAAEGIRELLDLLSTREKDIQPENAEDHLCRNIAVRVKMAVCESYVYRAKEERYSVLCEQLKYLENLKMSGDKNKIIEKAMEEILQEIAETADK